VNLTQLHYFKTVAEHGKIRSAAEELFISSPALSTSIAGLEQELGVKLFDRQSNRITLNEQGHIFLQCVERIFDDLEDTKLRMQHSLHQDDRILHIAVTTSDIWTPLISGFSKKFPDISLSCTTVKIQQLERNLSSVIYSFIFAEQGDLPHTNMEHIVLFEEHPMVVLSKEHPLAGCSKILLSDLADETFFLPMVGHSMNARLRKMLVDSGCLCKRVYECSDSIARSMVLEGDGVSFCTDRSTRLESAGLCYIPLEVPECNWVQCIFWNKTVPLSPGEKTFKNYVLQMYLESTNDN